MRASRFRDVQDVLGYSVPELAKKLGRSERAVQRYRNGKQPVPLVVLLALAHLLDTAKRRGEAW